jgi:hypothetical protein
MATGIAFRGVTLDQASINAIGRAEHILGYALELMQGSWSTSVAASAGTHSGGGALDVRILGMSDAQQIAVVRALRQAGFAAWRRTPSEGFAYHVHCILIGDALVSPAAAEQLVQWAAHRNGLANHGADTDSVDVAAGRPPLWSPPPTVVKALVDLGD